MTSDLLMINDRRRQDSKHAWLANLFERSLKLVLCEHLLDMLTQRGLAIRTAVKHMTARILVYRDP
jgi:hypothetical protein